MTEINNVSDEQISTGFLFWRVYTLWHNEINKHLKLHSLTHTQFVILSVTNWLNLNSKLATQASIVEFSKIDKMTVSKSIRQLELFNFVSRSANATDSRTYTLNLTVAGTALISKLMINIENTDKYFFSFRKQEQLDSFNFLLQNLLVKHL